MRRLHEGSKYPESQLIICRKSKWRKKRQLIKKMRLKCLSNFKHGTNKISRRKTGKNTIFQKIKKLANPIFKQKNSDFYGILKMDDLE